MPKNTPVLIIERLKDLLLYDRHKGTFFWRKQRMGRMKPGDEAGTVNADGLVMIGIDGRLYTAARLAWFYVHGEWPRGRVRFKDGNRENLRIDNLYDEAAHIPASPAAAYQRARRAERKWVDNKIASDPELYSMATDPKTATAIYRMVRDERRAYLHQNGFTDGYYPPKGRNR